MSQPHHSDPIEDSHDSSPVNVAIGIGIAFVAVIIAIALLAHYAIGAYGSRPLANDPTMRPEMVAKRIAPDAKLAVDPNAPVAPAAPAQLATPAAQVAAVPPPAAGGKAEAGGAGKATFDKVCTACHTAGVAGAPKLGDKAAWTPRIATGKDTLYNAALKGKGAMPPKGGNPALSDADVKAAVDYMVAAAK